MIPSRCIGKPFRPLAAKALLAQQHWQSPLRAGAGSLSHSDLAKTRMAPVRSSLAPRVACQTFHSAKRNNPTSENLPLMITVRVRTPLPTLPASPAVHGKRTNPRTCCWELAREMRRRTVFPGGPPGRRIACCRKRATWLPGTPGPVINHKALTSWHPPTLDTLLHLAWCLRRGAVRGRLLSAELGHARLQSEGQTYSKLPQAWNTQTSECKH